MIHRAFRLAAFLAIAVACGGSKGGPTGPDPTPTPTPSPTLDLTGTWSGPASDSSGPGTMTWVLTRNAAGASGTSTTRTPQGSVVLTGTVTLQLTGSNASWTINIPAGGVQGNPGCTVTATGTATASTTAITGTYTGTGSCSPPFTGGTISLAKQ